MVLPIGEFDVSKFKQHRSTIIFGQGMLQLLPLIVDRLLPNSSSNAVWISSGPISGTSMSKLDSRYFRQLWVQERKESLLIDSVSMLDDSKSYPARNIILNCRVWRVSAFFLKSRPTRIPYEPAIHADYFIFSPNLNPEERACAFHYFQPMSLPFALTHAQINEFFDLALGRNCLILLDLSNDGYLNSVSFLPLSESP